MNRKDYCILSDSIGSIKVTYDSSNSSLFIDNKDRFDKIYTKVPRGSLRRLGQMITELADELDK